MAAVLVATVVLGVGLGLVSGGRGVPVLAGSTVGTAPYRAGAPPTGAAPVGAPGTQASTAPSATHVGPDGRVPAAVARSVRAATGRGITQSVVVVDRRSGRTISSVRADVRVPAMSLVKLFLAADILVSHGGAGQVEPTTLAELHRMIATSDDSLASFFYMRGGAGQIITRSAARYHLTGTQPSPRPRYWGDVQVTAADLASFLTQALADPRTGPFLTTAMRATTRIAADGLDQGFGMNAVAGAGSKQGWGCCLGGVVAVHSVGFTAERIVVVLSTAAPDSSGLRVSRASRFEADPGFRASAAAVTATTRAALSGVDGP